MRELHSGENAPPPLHGLAWGVFGVIIVTACKWTVTYGKTALFLVYHSSGATPTPAAAQSQNARHGDDDNTDDLSPDLFRWAGAGMQVGSLFGSLIFFTLTIPFKIINN